MSRRDADAARDAATCYRAEPFSDAELREAAPRLRAPVAEHIDPETRFGLTAKGRAHLSARDLDRALAKGRRP
jgi:hypothetical protein